MSSLKRWPRSVTGCRSRLLPPRLTNWDILFGSVTERDIAGNLRQQGFAIQDTMVKLPAGHLKELGTYDLTLNIAAELTAPIRVIVVSQDETVDAVKEETTTTED